MTNFASLWADYALYLPALSNGYSAFAAQRSNAQTKARLPSGVRPTDFNFLNAKSKLYHWPNALYSAALGFEDQRPDIVKTRDRQNTFAMADSGGFSLISGAVKYSEASFRAKVLQWQEAYFDVGLILDVPTRALSVPASGVTTFAECLNRTIDNLKFAQNNRSASSLRLLSVYQGRDHKEAEYWREQIAPYPLEGLAIAGHTRLDMWFWAKQFRKMLDAGTFDHVTHIHFLGTSRPSFAVLATALQRALRRHVNDIITVSFDSSRSFSIVQRYGQITTGLDVKDGEFRLLSHTLPQHGGDFHPDSPFPFSSPLGDRCRTGDFMPGRNPADPAADTLGKLLLTNHSVYAELSGILQANRLVDMAQNDKNSLVPWGIRQSVEALDKVFSGSDVENGLKALRTHGRKLNADVSGENERSEEGGEI